MTATTLLAVAALHVAWGRGSTFPFASADELAERVVGSRRVPSPLACNVIAGLLGSGAILVTVRPRWAIHRTALRAMAAVLATRAAFGFAGRTDLLVPGSDSAAFRRRDRSTYAPLCAALAAGTLTATRRSA
ncbi:MAG: DUF3995 domain-containing protein [Actinobacteria bacterium]|nr:DUF3995 domain-containing protein [Actinomycetota bacterium]